MMFQNWFWKTMEQVLFFSVLWMVGSMSALIAGPPDVPDRYASSIQKYVELAENKIKAGPYRADYDQLSDVRQTPEWFKDAKLGIYFHWGPISVPAYNDFYAERMFKKGSDVYKHHVKTYGEPDSYPYHRFIPQFAADRFDADEWAELFERAGAKFAGPVAEHHDGYSNWNSEVNPWNAVDTGPEKDLTGRLETAIKEQDMKFVTTFHHAHSALRKSNGNWKGYYQGVGTHFSSLLEDPMNRMLYGYMPRPRFEQYWLAKTVEVIEQYRPDLVWFDSWLHELSEEKRAQFAAYYYNRAQQWGKQVGITRKQDDLPLDFSIEDFEKGRSADLTDHWWLTDDTLSTSSWFYTRGMEMKSVSRMLHDFIDIVSKRGCLLLNISPKPDGTIPKNQKELLLKLGDWLETNGEAIYRTRPWKTFGEGPTKLKKGGHFLEKVTYTSKDLRFTQSKNGEALYVIALGWPGDSLVPETIHVTDASAGTVKLLGYQNDLEYSVDNGTLRVDVPQLNEGERPSRHAYAFKLTDFQLRYQNDVNASFSFNQPVRASNVYKDQVDRHGPSKAVDGDMNTRWATDADVHDPWITIDLEKPRTVSRIKVSESHGKRIQSHSLQYKLKSEGEWKTIYRGKTVGKNFERSFEPVKARFVRLNIHDATKGPTINEIWLNGPSK